MISSNLLLRCVLLGAMFFPATALGQSRNTDADRLYNEGLANYEDGEFEEALTRYRAAYALDPAPDIWSNIIFCLKDLGQDVLAISEYDAHVVQYWPELSQSTGRQIMDYMLHVGKVAGFGLMELDIPNTAVLVIDGERRGLVGAHTPLRAPAGKHEVRVEDLGMATVTQNLDVTAGQSTYASIKLSSCPTKPRTEEVSKGAAQCSHEGIEYFNEGDFEQALERFRASHILKPNARTWANIIYCLLNLGRDIEAIGEYDALIESGHVEMSNVSQRELEARLLTLGKTLGFGLLLVNTPVHGVILVDQKRMSDLPAGILRRVPAGKHVVRLEAPGMAATEETVEVQSGQRSRVRLSPRKPFYIDVRLGLIGGKKTRFLDLTPATTCSVYCFPGMSVLIGGRFTIPLREPLVAEVGGDYMYLSSSIDAIWQDKKRPTKLESDFSLHAGLAHASAGMDVRHGSFRLQWRLGLGVVFGQHTERGVTSFETTILDDGENRAKTFLHHALVRGRIGLSVQSGRMWFGIGLEGLTTLAAGPTTNVPHVHDIDTMEFELEGPIGDGRRSLGHLFVISPEVNAGWSF